MADTNTIDPEVSEEKPNTSFEDSGFSEIRIGKVFKKDARVKIRTVRVDGKEYGEYGKISVQPNSLVEILGEGLNLFDSVSLGRDFSSDLAVQNPTFLQNIIRFTVPEYLAELLTSEGGSLVVKFESISNSGLNCYLSNKIVALKEESTEEEKEAKEDVNKNLDTKTGMEASAGGFAAMGVGAAANALSAVGSSFVPKKITQLVNRDRLKKSIALKDLKQVKKFIEEAKNSEDFDGLEEIYNLALKEKADEKIIAELKKSVKDSFVAKTSNFRVLSRGPITVHENDIDNTPLGTSYEEENSGVENVNIESSIQTESTVLNSDVNLRSENVSSNLNTQNSVVSTTEVSGGTSVVRNTQVAGQVSVSGETSAPSGQTVVTGSLETTVAGSGGGSVEVTGVGETSVGAVAVQSGSDVSGGQVKSNVAISGSGEVLVGGRVSGSVNTSGAVSASLATTSQAGGSVSGQALQSGGNTTQVNLNTQTARGGSVTQSSQKSSGPKPSSGGVGTVQQSGGEPTPSASENVSQNTPSFSTAPKEGALPTQSASTGSQAVDSLTGSSLSKTSSGEKKKPENESENLPKPLAGSEKVNADKAPVGIQSQIQALKDKDKNLSKNLARGLRKGMGDLPSSGSLPRKSFAKPLNTSAGDSVLPKAPNLSEPAGLGTGNTASLPGKTGVQPTNLNSPNNELENSQPQKALENLNQEKPSTESLEQETEPESEEEQNPLENLEIPSAPAPVQISKFRKAGNLLKNANRLRKAAQVAEAAEVAVAGSTVLPFLLAVLAVLFVLIFLLVAIVYGGCNYPVKGPLSYLSLAGQGKICEYVDNTSLGQALNTQLGNSQNGQSGLAPTGLLNTGAWTEAINAASAKFPPTDSCILRVVVQKESGGKQDSIGCDCAYNDKPQFCPGGKQTNSYYASFPFNWDECSYGIGLTQWTIYQKKYSNNPTDFRRWQSPDVPSRTPFGTQFYTINDFLDPNISLNLTAEKFSKDLQKNGNNVEQAFAAYVGSSTSQKKMVEERMALYNMCKQQTGQ